MTNRDRLYRLKPPTTGAYNTPAFTGTLNLYGSTYVKPAKGNTVLSTTEATSVTFHVDNGNLNPTPTGIEGTLSVKNAVTFPKPPTDDIKVTITTSDGLFTGSFKDPTPGARNATRTFHGAIFESLGFGCGEFEGPTEAGSVVWGPSP